MNTERTSTENLNGQSTIESENSSRETSKMWPFLTKPMFVFGFGLAIALAGAIVFLVTISTNSIANFTIAYWGLISAFLGLAVIFKYIQYKNQPRLNTNPKSRILTSTFLFLIIAGVCSLISMIAFFGARKYDKTGSIFAFASFVLVIIITFLHFQSEPKLNGVSWKIWAAARFVCGCIFILLILSSTNQAIGLARENSVPGKLIYLKKFGFNIHMFCGGEKKNEKDPLIWFEHGLGGSSLDFSWAHRNVSQFSRWCAYDHAGLGWSDIPNGRFPRTTEQIVEELQELLIEADINDDLFVVGHSMAGYNMRVAQRILSGNKIVGMVLVDPVDTDWEDCKEGATGYVSPLMSLSPHINTFGIPRLLKNSGVFPAAVHDLPNPEAYFSNIFLNHNLYTRSSEARNFIGSCGYAKRIVNEVAINGSKSENITEGVGDIPFGLVLAQKDNGIDAKEMSRLSAEPVVRTAPNSNHNSILFVEKENELVNDVIRNVWDKLN